MPGTRTRNRKAGMQKEGDVAPRATTPTGAAVELGRGRKPLSAGAEGRRAEHGGFTLIEILIGAAILAVALLAIANMFPTGYTNVTEAGRRTMALTGARQILEDMRSLPFDNLDFLNGFNSTNQVTLPAANPQRDMARRWRYALAGEGDGFIFTPAEKNSWATLSTAVPFNGSVQVSVAPTASPTLRLVTVTITFAAKSNRVQLATLITRLI